MHSNFFAPLEQIYEQSLKTRLLNIVGHAKCTWSIICSGLKYNEASECIFVLHATP